MNATMIETVRKLRKSYVYPLGSALAAARYEIAAPRFAFLDDMDAYPSPDDKPITGTVNGMTVTVKLFNDYESNIGEDDVTGTFTDSYEPGCIKSVSYGQNANGFEWYKPANCRIDDGWRWYHDNYGMSRQVAREYVAALIRDDMRDDAERYYVGIEVTLSVAGHDIGSASLWGIDNAGDANKARSYLIDTAADLIDEALAEVPGNIDREIKSATDSRDALIAVRATL
jgi:hypothetical protein